MVYLLVAFVAYVVVSLWYIHKLHVRIRSFETAWSQIENLTDHNKDGDVVIHVQHTEH